MLTQSGTGRIIKVRFDAPSTVEFDSFQTSGSEGEQWLSGPGRRLLAARHAGADSLAAVLGGLVVSAVG